MISVNVENCPGILHDADGDIGVIMCAAQGFEELCSRKDWRVLAQSIADLGLPVLRFDYHGTGDSPGGDDDPERVQAWLATLKAAIAFMRERVGVSRIVLVGLRLGAALAAMAARDEDGIEGYVALNPVVSGKAYARELGIMAKTIAIVESAPAPIDGLEVAGFAVTAQTLAALRELDLFSPPRAPAPRVLVCAPQPAAASDRLAALWRELGADVASMDFPHYAEWMSDPTMSRPPAEAIANIVEWMARHIAPLVRARAQPLSAFDAVSFELDQCIEEPIWFGPEKKLFAILCSPTNATPGAATVVITNAGRNYHIGWARSSVNLARALAAAGHASLRIDVAGIGDSPDIPGRDPRVMYSDEPIADLSAAINFLEARGLGNFCVAGLCSGAHLAFHTALVDARIKQLAMVNLQRFIWKPGMSLEIAIRQSFRSTGFYWRSSLQLATWRRVLRGEVKVVGIVNALTSRLAEKLAARVGNLFQAGDDESARVRAGLTLLSRRDVRLLLIYADNDGGIDELARHIGGGARRLTPYPGARLELLEGADHNITPRAARARVTALVMGLVGGGEPTIEARPHSL